MIGNKLSDKKINFLEYDYDEERFNDMTSTEYLDIYISQINSYYFLKRKYNIKDKNFFLILDIIEVIEKIEMQLKQLSDLPKTLEY